MCNHPGVFEVPFLLHCKGTYILSSSPLKFASNPAIRECLAFFSDPMLLKGWTYTLLELAHIPILSSTKTAIKPKAKIFQQFQANYWNPILNPLLVQSKSKDIIRLKSQSQNHLRTGLPACQLSSLMKVGADCLSVTLNL